MEARILRIVADLLNDKGKQYELDRDPEEFLSRYGLDEGQKALLFTFCKPLIAEAIRKEIDGWEMDMSAHYPGPEPHIAELAPDRAIAGSVVDLQIRGEAILRSAEVKLVSPGDGSLRHEIACPVRSITGSFRLALIEATADLSDAPPGDYQLQVFNSAKVPILDEMNPAPSRQDWPGLPPIVSYFPFRVLDS